MAFTLLVLPDFAAADLYVDVNEPGGPAGNSGFDVRFPAHVTVGCDAPTIVDLGVRMRCQAPDGTFCAFMMVPRSSMGKSSFMLANSIGIIDQGYTGTLKAPIRNFGQEQAVPRGTAMLQIVHPSLAPMRARVVDASHPAFATGATVRGDGGLGSTGGRGADAPAA